MWMKFVVGYKYFNNFLNFIQKISFKKMFTHKKIVFFWLVG